MDAGSTARAIRVRIRVDGLELRAEGAKAGFDRVHALLPVAPLADPERPLHDVVVRLEVGDGERRAPVAGQTRRRVPLRDVALVGAEGDLRVDRRRSADAAPGDERHELAARLRGEPERPEEIVRRLRLPAHEVRRAVVRPGLEQQHVPPAPRQLARDDPASGAGPDHDDVECVLHAIPR